MSRSRASLQQGFAAAPPGFQTQPVRPGHLPRQSRESPPITLWSNTIVLLPQDRFILGSTGRNLDTYTFCTAGNLTLAKHIALNSKYNCLIIQRKN